MSSVAFAQTFEDGEQSENPKAYIFSEFSKANDSEVKKKWGEFFTQLKKEENSQGYVINYGTPKEIAKRERQLENTTRFRHDGPRITFAKVAILAN